MEMSIKVAIFAWQNVGGSFLDWSLHWLTGAQKFYNEHRGWINLVDQPLSMQNSNLNSHNHDKNYPRGNTQLLKTIEKFNRVDSAKLLTCYLHPMPIEDTISLVDVSESVSETHKLAVEELKNDFVVCQQTCYDNDVKVVILALNDPIYNQKLRYAGPTLTSTKLGYTNEIDIVDDYLSTFFNPTYNEWKNNLSQINVWDQREFYAINMRPYAVQNLGEYINYTQPTIYIDARELFFNGKETLDNLINSLGMKLDESRLQQWIPIYLEWQESISKILKFSWNVDRICECIIKNLYYDISTYNFEFWQEAIIQHIMIHKYGVNFKIWNLEKFPSNTQDLHKLLEPNIHIINKEDWK